MYVYETIIPAVIVTVGNGSSHLQGTKLVMAVGRNQPPNDSPKVSASLISPS
jgi:hypothetical protein